MPVNRLFAILMLVQFVAQHFSCCCTGCGSTPQQQNKIASASTAYQASAPRRQCCQRHRDRTAPADSKRPASTSRDRIDHSQDDSHHHLCFASHIVFNATSRTMVTPSELFGGEFILPSEYDCRRLLKSVISCREFIGTNPVSFNCHERSVLGVYRI